MNKTLILRKLLELMGYNEDLSAFLDETAATFEVMAAELGASMSEWRKNISVGHVLDEAAEALKDEFEPEELSAMMAFFRTKIGRRIIRKLPSFTEKLCEVANGHTLQSIENFLNKKQEEVAAKRRSGGSGGSLGPN